MCATVTARRRRTPPCPASPKTGYLISLLLARLARALAHHWKRSLAVAVAVIVGLGVLAGTVGGTSSDDFSIPGTETQRALDLLKAHSPGQAGADATLVFSTTSGKITDPAKVAAIDGALAQIAKQPDVAAAPSPFAAGNGRLIAADQRVAYTTIPYTLQPAELKKHNGEDLEQAARTAESAGVQVAMRGEVADLAAQQDAPMAASSSASRSRSSC